MSRQAIEYPLSIPMGKKADCPHEANGFLCTLDAGHEGPHAAHGSDAVVPRYVWSSHEEVEA